MLSIVYSLPYPRFLNCCYFPTRVEILTLLGMCHGKGRVHINDFAERNVVVRNGKYRLIDFHDVEGHECGYQEDVDWRPGEFFLEAQSDFPCDTLAELAEAMHIWRTSECFVCQSI